MPTRLDPCRHLLGQHVLPRYEELGSLAQFQGMARAVRDGRGEPAHVLDPLTAVSGFYYGELLADPAGHGEQAKAALRPFPAALKLETARRARGHRETSLTHLRTLAERADWYLFHKSMVEATRTVLLALFSAAEVYYPGDKWLRAAIVRFGLDPRVLTALQRVGARDDAYPSDRGALAVALPPGGGRVDIRLPRPRLARDRAYADPSFAFVGGTLFVAWGRRAAG